MIKSNTKFSIVGALAIIGSSLFYEQFVGLNVLVYTIISIACVAYLHPTRSFKDIFYSGCIPLVCGVLLALYPQILTFWVWILSYVIMWSKSVHPYNSLLLPFHGLLSQIRSPWMDLAQFLKLKQAKLDHPEEGNRTINKVWIYIISSVIILVFVLLYTSSNTVIGQFIGEINLDYFEMGWFFLMAFFFMAMYGLVFFKKNKLISKLNTTSNIIHPLKDEGKETMVYQLAKITLWVLVVLISIVNLIDVSVMVSDQLPEGMTYSSYVHQGFNTLIFSLILAVALVLYFFKSQVNFHPAVKTIKTLSFVWIAQNILLASITAYKNMLYVHIYGFTYLRIAVFFGLVCSVIALVLAIRKLIDIKSNWFYINMLSKYCFIALFTLSLFPIDLLITRYNIHYAQEKDIRYLSYLDHPDVKLLLKHQAKTHPTLPWFDMGVLQTKMFGYQDKYQQKGWPSYCWYYESLQEIKPY